MSQWSLICFDLCLTLFENVTLLSSQMTVEKIAISIFLHHYWKKGMSTMAAVAEICEVKGDGKVNKTTAIGWYKHFNNN